MTPTLNMVLIYARDQQKSADFYTKFFGFQEISNPGDGLIELRPPEGSGGATLYIHRAAKSVKLGQVGVKLVFAVPDVDAFKARSAKLGLVFGSTHQGDGYTFANAKDPDKNNVAISSRPFRQR